MTEDLRSFHHVSTVIFVILKKKDAKSTLDFISFEFISVYISRVNFYISNTKYLRIFSDLEGIFWSVITETALGQWKMDYEITIRIYGKLNCQSDTSLRVVHFLAMVFFQGYAAVLY
jgi:hypothetical protein